LLLTRRGLVFARELNAEVPGALVHGVELELAELGYVLSPRLRARLGRQTADTLGDLHAWLVGSLAAALGADRQHTPLFRNFPHDVPTDTGALATKDVGAMLSRRAPRLPTPWGSWQWPSPFRSPTC
jgi:hypothetical protein